MAKITRKDAAERIAALINGRTQMTEAEFNEIRTEIENNTVKDLLKSLHMTIVDKSIAGPKHGVICTKNFSYADVEIIDEEPKADEFITEAVKSAKAAAEEMIKMIKGETEAPKTMSVSHYTNNKGKTYDAHNMISKSRAEQMRSKGYTYEIVNTGELAQEAYDRLIEKFEVVRIYTQTTKVRGYHEFYAMCK